MKNILLKFFVLGGLILTAATAPLCAQDQYDKIGWLPEKENHLVYDYCGTLTAEQTATLEARLLAFNDSTSNQIVVMITPGFGGNDITQFAIDVGRKWGIGQKDLKNGVIIVIKPKDDTRGEVDISTGYGLEGALPDVFCKRIIEDEMIPHFQEEDYYGGIVAALDVILPVCAGEYSFDQYKEDNDVNPFWVLLCSLGIIVLIIFLIAKADKSGWGNGGSGSSSFGGPTHFGGWGGSSFGGFSGGHSSGGFGGFGGGSFGGGGARGSW